MSFADKCFQFYDISVYACEILRKRVIRQIYLNLLDTFQIEEIK